MNTSASRGWLTTTAVALSAALAILGCATAVMAILAVRGQPVSFSLPVETALGAQPGQATLVPAVELGNDATVATLITEPTAAQSAWGTLIWLPSALLGGGAFGLVLLAVLRARRGDPFSRGVVGITRAIGLLVFVGVPLTQLLRAVGTFKLADSVLAGGGHFSVMLTFDGPIIGLCVFALAEVMSHGQRLREELDVVI